MGKLEWNFNDGGRSQYYKAKNVGDCATRAFAIATGKDYKEVYNLFRKECKGSPRNGVQRPILRKVAKMLGGEWHPTMGIGTGGKVHLREGEIPMDSTIVCNLSHHVVAVINGVINDTYDCTRDGKRLVYGYWEFN